MTPLAHLTSVDPGRRAAAAGQRLAAAGVQQPARPARRPAGRTPAAWSGARRACTTPPSWSADPQAGRVLRGRRRLSGRHPAARLRRRRRDAALKCGRRRGLRRSPSCSSAPRYYLRVERARGARLRRPDNPGVMPVTNARQINRIAQLSGQPFPAEVDRPVAGGRGRPGRRPRPRRRGRHRAVPRCWTRACPAWTSTR